MFQRIIGIVLILFSLPAMAASDYDKELLYRIRFSSAQDIKLLLDSGANPNAENEQGIPALTAVQSRTDNQIFPIVKLLVEKGADINNGGTAKKPPLIEAARTGDKALVEYFVEKKANLHVRDAQNYDAVAMAKENGKKEIADYITQVIMSEKPLKPKTPEFKAQQTRLLGYNTCARQYLSFYYASKQDPIPEDVQKKTLGEHEAAMRSAAADLYQVFAVPVMALTEFQKKIASTIAQQLNDLISNRNRRANGVGKEEDMKKRCDKIGEQIKLIEPRAR